MVVSGKKRRLAITECGCDINMMIDLAKAADLVTDWTILTGADWCIYNPLAGHKSFPSPH
uniref:Uncharacterized protein n=1 Tax=Piliocolobus tephrosceles TaxID=591936 RepID=A0A8C9GMQ2_9PRIM